MIFWILLVLAVIATIGTVIYFIDDMGTLVGAFPGVIVGVSMSMLIGGLIIGGLNILIPHEYDTAETTTELRAIDTGSTIKGRFYLGSGYINGERTINYIEQISDGDGTYSTVRQASAGSSRIFEDADQPTVTDYKFTFYKPWLFPGAFSENHSYDFHVPEGSVLEDYTIDNG